MRIEMENTVEVKESSIIVVIRLFMVSVITTLIGIITLFSLLKGIEFLQKFFDPLIFLTVIPGFFAVWVVWNYGSATVVGGGYQFYRIEGKPFLSFRDFIFKYISTFVTLAFGGVGDLSSPMAHMGASISSMFSDEDIEMAKISGVSSVLAAYLGLPFSAAVITVEILGEKKKISIEKVFIALFSASFGFLLGKLLKINLLSSISFPFYYRFSSFIISIPIAIIFTLVGYSLMKMYKLGEKFFDLLGMTPFRYILGGVVMSLLFFIFDYSKFYTMKFTDVIFLKPSSLLIFAVSTYILNLITISVRTSAGRMIPGIFISLALGLLMRKVFNDAFFVPLIFSSFFSGFMNLPFSSIILAIEIFGVQSGVPVFIGSSIAYFVLMKENKEFI